MHDFKGRDADGEDFDRDDTVLSEVFIRFEDDVSLYLYADLLPVRHGSDQEIRRYKRYLSCLQADSAMSPVCKRRL